RIAVPRKFFCEELDPEVTSAFEQAITVLSTMSDISEINFEVPTDRTLQKAESYAYHCEFVRQSPELYQPETLRRIRTGEGISPKDAARCKRELQEARKQIASVFNDVDLLITPTTPTLAPVISELKANPDLLRPRELALLRNTRPMNAHLRGTLLAKHPNQAVVETGGIGYDVTISVPTFSDLPGLGSNVALHIHTHVREDVIALYGFLRPEQKQLFEKLITVSGIGPKLAITILSGMAADEIVKAIRGNDVVRLTRIPGIGKKTA